jgi:hypothetical protein
MISKTTGINRPGTLTGITKRDMIIIPAGKLSIIHPSIITAKNIDTIA